VEDDSRVTPRGYQAARRFLFVLHSWRAPPPWWRGFTEAQASEERGRFNGTGYGQVVQRCEGLRLHYPGGWRRRVRAFQRHSGPGLQEPGRGRQGRVRGDQGSEGAPGRERSEGLTKTSRQTEGRVPRRGPGLLHLLGGAKRPRSRAIPPGRWAVGPTSSSRN